MSVMGMFHQPMETSGPIWNGTVPRARKPHDTV